MQGQLNYFDTLSVLLLILVAFVFLKMNRPFVTHQQFDEMQMMYRFKAYQTAFFTCIILSLISAVFLQLGGSSFIPGHILIYAVLIVTVGVFANQCILHGSYDRINPKAFWLLSIINGFSSFMILFVKRSLIENGKITSGLITVLMFLFYLSISLCSLYREQRDKREEEEL